MGLRELLNALEGFDFRESIRTQNYSVPASLERRLHDLYLHYAAPTMGGPQLLSKLPDDRGRMQPPMSQSDFMKWGKQPIWSGGTYWDNWVGSTQQL